MKRICLAIPTNRECTAAIAALVQEAGHAVQHFPVQVVVLIADTASSAIAAANAHALLQAMHAMDAKTNAVEAQHNALDRRRIEAHHFTAPEQAALLTQIISRAGLQARELDHERKRELEVDLERELHALLLPDTVSYGAATNRLFLLAQYLGCDSLHRRDSDSRYQSCTGRESRPALHGNEPACATAGADQVDSVIYPIHHELRCIGMPASTVATLVDQTIAAPLHADCPVMLVGASYVGALSIDVAPMFARDADAAYRIVGQFAPSHLSAADKRAWVDCSYLHTGQSRFEQDRSELAHGHSFLIDTCNICFSQIQQVLPLPPACDTIGTDYFLLSLMNILALPVVHHNRHIENFHTPERRSAQGFVEYQFRLVKYFLYMSWLHATVRALDHAKVQLWLAPPGATLAWNLPLLHALLAEPEPLSRIDDENAAKLRELQQQYTRLGGAYAEFAALLAEQAPQLLQACRDDIARYAAFAPHWPALMRAARTCFDGENACPRT